MKTLSVFRIYQKQKYVRDQKKNPSNLREKEIKNIENSIFKIFWRFDIQIF